MRALWTVVLLVSAAVVTMGRMCYVCSYTSYNDPKSYYRCANNTVAVAYTLNCSQERYCTLDVQFDRKTLDVVSVSRGCLAYRPNSCADDWTHRQCTYSCLGEFCNNITATAIDNRRYIDTNGAHRLKIVSDYFKIYVILLIFSLLPFL